jgi:hypothetical protein
VNTVADETEEKISPEEALRRMKEIWATADTEMAHVYADELMLTILRQSGFAEVAEEFENQGKWYA